MHNFRPCHKTSAKFQKDLFTTVGGVASTRYLVTELLCPLAPERAGGCGGGGDKNIYPGPEISNILISAGTE